MTSRLGNENYQSELKRQVILMMADGWDELPQYKGLDELEKLIVSNQKKLDVTAFDPNFFTSGSSLWKYVEEEKAAIEERRRLVALEAALLKEQQRLILHDTKTTEMLYDLVMTDPKSTESLRALFSEERRKEYLREEIRGDEDTSAEELLSRKEEGERILKLRNELRSLEMQEAIRNKDARKERIDMDKENRFKFMTDEEKLLELDAKRQLAITYLQDAIGNNLPVSEIERKRAEVLGATANFADAFGAYVSQVYTPALTSGVVSDQELWGAQAFALQRAMDVKDFLGGDEEETVEGKVQAILDHLRDALPRNRGAIATEDDDLSAGIVYRGLLPAETF